MNTMEQFLKIKKNYTKKYFLYAFLGMSLLILSSSFACKSILGTDSIVGKWRNEIIVGTSPVYVNMITFKKDSDGQTFLDQNNHSGDWTIKGESITWIYKGIPKLENTFIGKVSKDGKTMEGINYGTWNGDKFKGTWKAIKE